MKLVLANFKTKEINQIYNDVYSKKVSGFDLITNKVMCLKAITAIYPVNGK